MTSDLHNLLRKDLQNKIRKNVLYSKDCELLSLEIKDSIQRHISISTIKRFFGIIRSDFKPSVYTLDTFCQFLGYKDWGDYVKVYEENSVFSKNTWDRLKTSMLIVTNESLFSLKQKTDYASKKRFLRDFAKKRFEDFLESPKNALMLVAPNGYGKSSLAIQLTEHYFLNENAKYKNDAVGLIDGGIFFNLFTKSAIIPFLNQFLDFKINASMGLYFMNHPEQIKGRICAIVDNMDEIFSDKENYHRLVENISKIIMANKHDWFKMIFVCRPENLEPFNYQINKNPVFKSCWFNTDFTDPNPGYTTNIPLFEKDEIESILTKSQCGFDYDYLTKNHKNLLNIIRYPYFLFLFLEEYEKGQTDFTENDLLSHYLQRKLTSTPYREEKLNIINQFIELTKWGKESNSVKKSLLQLNNGHNVAYQELISQGVIYEYIGANSVLDNNTFVRFNQKVIFEYILFEKWHTDRKLNVDLFFEIIDFYMNNIQLQCNLLNFFTRTLIQKSSFDIIKQILAGIEKKIPTVNAQVQIPTYLSSVSLVINDAFRTNTRFREKLIPWISNSKLGEILYPNF